MIFISRKRFEEKVHGRVLKEQERIRIDQQLYEMREMYNKLLWRVEAMENERNHDVPVCTCKGEKWPTT